MFVGSSENCAVTKSKGTPSDQTSCTGLMNVDLGALMMANLQSSRDAYLRVANPESRSTDKARQPVRFDPIQTRSEERSISTGILECGVSVHRRITEAIDVVGQAQSDVVCVSHWPIWLCLSREREL